MILMRAGSAVLMVCASARLWAAADLPRFEEYPSPTDWRGPAAAVKLITRSEQMFRTLLLEAGRQPPNFAGHYRITYWGCGSNCSASAVVDLQTGDIYPPFLGGKGQGWERWISCTASFEGTDDEFYLDSRLMIVRCGLNVDPNGKNKPDLYYLLWEGTKFKELLHPRTEADKSKKGP